MRNLFDFFSVDQEVMKHAPFKLKLQTISEKVDPETFGKTSGRKHDADEQKKRENNIGLKHSTGTIPTLSEI